MSRKVNFLGFELDIIDEHDVDEAVAEGGAHPYVVSRVADTDVTAGTLSLRTRRNRTLCELCSEVCFIDPWSYYEVARMTMVIICIPCMIDRRDEVDQMVEQRGHQPDEPK